MFDAQVIKADHRDVIHDVAYDYYGQRMATCSSDQSVKVWDLIDGTWTVTCSWKAHSGSVWRLSWAHPEFGRVLATCSFDRTASVWEEVLSDKLSSSNVLMKRWVRRTTFVDSRTNVTDVKFAPKHQGLMLATCSADGIIRIYEAPDIMNLAQWTLAHDIACKIPLSCISWNPSMFRLGFPMIAAGSDEVSVSSGGKVFIFEFTSNGKWMKSETINTVTEPVHDISFAPNIGRCYHILAVASKNVHIFNLNPVTDGNVSNMPRLEVKEAAQFQDHFSTVWRVTWNVTGTILASTGDDGFIRMWKRNHAKQWKCIGSYKPEDSQQELQIQTLANPSISSSTTAKYLKLGTISHPTQVPWH